MARGVLIGQALFVGVRVLARRTQISSAIRALLPGWRLPAVLGVMFLVSATLARDPAAYVAELVLGAFVQVVQLATIALAVTSLSSGSVAAFTRLADRVLGAPSDDITPGTFDRFALLAAAWTIAVAYLLAVFSYQRHPHVPDEVIYLMHARYFAQGLLAMPVPPVAQAFDVDLLTLDPTQWYSPVPPGWPAMLAVGARLNAPWLVNPVLAGVNVLLSYALLRELYVRRTARLIVLLLCASPWAVFLAMSLMTHTFTLTCGLLAALAVARMRRLGSLAWAIVGGAALGVISLIRPLDAAAAAALLGLWSLRARWRGLPLVPSVLLTVTAAAVGAVQLWYNHAMTGDSRTFPIMLYTDRLYGPETNALGFGANRGLGWGGLDPFPGHGLIDVFVNINLNVTTVNADLLGWSCGSLLAIVVLLSRGRITRSDWYMIAVVAMVAGIHTFYWFSGGPDFAARYWYLIILPMLALSGRGVVELDAAIRDRWPLRVSGALQGAMMLTLLALLVFFPWRAIDKYYHYRGMRPDVRNIARERAFGGSLVLVRGARHPDFHSAVVYNPIDVRTGTGPVYARFVDGDARTQLLDFYRDRPVWVLEGPSITKGAYRVTGPMSNSEARLLP